MRAGAPLSLSVALTVKHSRLHLHTHILITCISGNLLKSRILWLSSFLRAFSKDSALFFFFSSFILGAGLICKVITRKMIRVKIWINFKLEHS